jgi:3'(2'), 5'-bisphosphate nucleotidase
LDHKQLLEDIAVAASAAAEAGEAILKIVEGGFEVESKPDDLSPVTIADRAAELIILGALAKAAPGVPVVAEEEVAAGRIPDFDDCYFLVDPLDGTKEFVRGGERLHGQHRPHLRQ